MRRIVDTSAFVSVLGLFVGLLCVMPAQAQTNVALNRPYTLSATPNYALTTDGGDGVQLTDGLPSSGTFHADPLSVGWLGRGSETVSVTVDLGQNELIEGLSFGTTGGFSGIAFPAFIDTWVSDDGITYHHAGELIAGSAANSLPDGGLLRGQPQDNRHVYQANDLRLQGQYVKFTVHRAAAYLFADEVQVFRGTFDPAEVSLSPIALSSGFEQWSIDHKDPSVRQVRMLYDLQELSKHSQASSFATQIESLRANVLAQPRLDGASNDYRAGLPYNALHQEIWSLNGQMNLADGDSEHGIGATDLYTPMHPFDAVADTPDTAALHLTAGEQRAMAVNVSNNANEARTAIVELDWSGNGPPPQSLELRNVHFTESQDRTIIGSALVEATRLDDHRWQVELPAGATSQLWLTVDGEQLVHGVYDGTLRVTPAGQAPLDQPLHVAVHRGRLTNDHLLETYGWDYLAPGNTALPGSDVNRTAIQAALQQHGMRSHWITPSALADEARSTPRNPDGTFDGQPGFSSFNGWLDELTAQPEPTDRYYAFLALEIVRPTYYSGGIESGEPGYETAIRSFFTALAGEIEAHGLDPSKFVFMPTDEPHAGSPFAQQSAEMMQLMKQAVPQFKVATTTVYSNVADVDQDLIGVTDVIIANMPRLRSNPELLDYYRHLVAREGKELGAYEATDGGLTRGPTNYYRKLAWEAAQLGLTHAGVWVSVRGDREDTFDDFSGMANFEMIFAAADEPEVTPSKALTAWRDGVQDYSYTRLAETTAGEVRNADVAPGLALWTKRRVRRIIDGTLDEMPSGHNWQYGEFNGSFDAGRMELLNVIDQVDRIAPKADVLLVDRFDQPGTSLDPARWTRHQPHALGPTNVTEVDPTTGTLVARGGEIALSAEAYDLTRNEVTMTALMRDHDTGDGLVAHLLNGDGSEQLEVIYNQLSASTGRVRVQRRVEGVLSSILSDQIVPYSLSQGPTLLAMNVADDHLEVSLVRRDEQLVTGFESAAYTPGQGINNVDGWQTTAGTYSVITPDTASGYTDPLHGDQALVLRGAASRGFDTGTTLSDGAVLSYRLHLDPGAEAALYISDSLSTGQTPGGIEFRDGRIHAFTPGTTHTGLHYADQTDYAVSMLMDFTADTFEIFLEEVNGPLFESLGTYAFWRDLDAATVLSEGGVWLVTNGYATYDDLQLLSPMDGISPAMLLYSGTHGLGGDLSETRFGLANELAAARSAAYWDEMHLSQQFAMIPEPATTTLLSGGLLGLLMRRSRHRCADKRN